MEYSIIICAYNIEKFIQRCIDSVLNNNFTDYEIIIVDDGSTDNTAAIIDKYKTNQHVKIFHNKNQNFRFDLLFACERLSTSIKSILFTKRICINIIDQSNLLR